MFKVLSNLLNKNECDRLSEIIRSQPNPNADPQVYKGYSYYNLPSINILQGLLCDEISNKIGKRIVPSYSFCRVYKKGSELVRHCDREECEVSITLNLSQTHPWPIYMSDTPILLDTGDAICYEGRTVEHWREPFQGDEYIQVFLIYVLENGQYRNSAWDYKKVPVGLPVQFHFKIQNCNLNSWWSKPSVFTENECRDITGTVVSKLGHLSRTVEYNWIYSKIADTVLEVNNSIYKFDISGFDEDIRFIEGCYDWRTDINESRKLSVCVNLSDPSTYDGGVLQFGDDEEAPRDLGSIVVFPSYKRHQITKVTRGERFSLELWVSGPSFR
jgi:hypothetical protein